MTKEILLFALLSTFRCISTQAPSIQCPQLFEYVRLGSTFLGKITLPNTTPGTTKLIVQLSQREHAATPNYYGKLELFEDKETTVNKLYSGQPLIYRIDFPTPNVLPKLTSIAVNDVVICSDTGYPPPSTVIRLTHTLTAADFGGSFQPYKPIQNQYQNYVPTVQKPQQLFPRTNFQQPTSTKNVRQDLTTTKTTTTTTTTSTSTRGAQNYAECGLENHVLTPYILGGELLSPRQFPWLAAIFVNSDIHLRFICGGTLVSSKTVITAAHCFQSVADRIVVQLGHYDLSDYSEVFETRSVKQLIKHPEFHSVALPDADIAVLHLSAAVSFSPSIRPACLWNEPIDVNLLVGHKAVVAGWGEDESGQVQTKPKKANAKVVPSTDCQQALSSNLISPTARALCVSGSDGSSPCRGDSGGGLVVFNNGRWTLRAIVSGGYSNERGCLLDYTFFCDLAQHKAWLFRNIV